MTYRPRYTKRPPGPESITVHMVPVNVLDEIERQAKAANLSRSEMIRSILTEWVDFKRVMGRLGREPEQGHIRSG